MSNPLAKLGDLTKPATVLIEKISEAVGGLFKPYQLVRVAKAEAEVSRIQAEAQIQVTDLHRRAMYRFLEEESKKQSNMEAITQNAILLLDDKSSPENVENDWITNFFEKSRIISDEEMQALWARVLAGEANAPGAFAKKTVNLLGDLDKEDAELFACLCGFGWKIDSVIPFVFDYQNGIYDRQGINFVTLSHLESLGLIQFHLEGMYEDIRQKNVVADYYGRQVLLTFPGDTYELSTGQVLLTRAGQQLASVCEPQAVDDFFDYVCDGWEAASLLPKRQIAEVIPGKAAQRP